MLDVGALDLCSMKHRWRLLRGFVTGRYLSHHLTVTKMNPQRVSTDSFTSQSNISSLNSWLLQSIVHTSRIDINIVTSGIPATDSTCKRADSAEYRTLQGSFTYVSFFVHPDNLGQFRMQWKARTGWMFHRAFRLLPLSELPAISSDIDKWDDENLREGPIRTPEPDSSCWN